MKPRIDLADFAQHISLADLKCAKTGKRAAFTTTACDMETNGYRKELWLWDGAAVSKAHVPEGCSFYEWETDDILLVGWRRKNVCHLGLLNTANNLLFEERDLPFAAQRVISLGNGLMAVTATTDWNEHENGLHRDFEIFEELPLRQNAGGYTSGRRCALFLYNAQSGKRIAVTEPTFDVEKVIVTPDGRCLIYSGRAYQDMRFLDHSIWQYDLATGEKVEILSQEKRMFLGYFACDEAGVIYSATDCKQYGFGQIKICIVTTLLRARLVCSTTASATWALVRLSQTAGAVNWISSVYMGGELYAGATWGYQNHIFKVSAAGELQKVAHADGSVDAFAISGDGALLAIAHLGRRLQELYLVKDGEFVRLTDFNEDFYQRTKPVDPQHFTFVNDGVELMAGCYCRIILIRKRAIRLFWIFTADPVWYTARYTFTRCRRGAQWGMW